MKKYTLFGLILLFVFIFSSVLIQRVFAADATMNKNWMCLQTPVNAQGEPLRCDQTPRGTCSGEGVPVHRAKLWIKETQKSRPNSKVFIVACFGAESGLGLTGQPCTTGNSSLDKQLEIFNDDYYEKIKKAQKDSVPEDKRDSAFYQFQGLFLTSNGTVAIHSENTQYLTNNYLTNYPVTANANGEINPVEWQDEFRPQSRNHKFMAFNLVNPNDQVSGTGGSLTQATFSFENAQKDCAMIAWDPFGIVFDAKTLEPVSGVRVKLFDKSTNALVSVPGVDPQPLTIDDGVFRFIVPNGVYWLEVEGYPIELDITKIHPNYTKAYSQLYPVQTGTEIVEINKVEHRDIPVRRNLTTASPQTPSAIYDFFQTPLDNGKIAVTGRVSHLLSRVEAYSAKLYSDQRKELYRKIASQISDKKGNFRILIDQSTLEKTDQYQEIVSHAEMVYVDLRENAPVSFIDRAVRFVAKGLEKFVGKSFVSAETRRAVIQLDPIPSYLEGYAMDASGKKLANATVGIYPKNSNSPSFQTKTDKNGYFKVTSEYLPPMAYEIRYKPSTGSSVNVSTSTFLATNQTTFKEKQIDPFVSRDKSNRVLTNATTEPVNNALTNTTTNQTSSTINKQITPGQKTSVGRNTTAPFINNSSQVNNQSGGTNLANMQGIIMLIVVILMLLGLGFGAILFMKAKQQQPPMY